MKSLKFIKIFLLTFVFLNVSLAFANSAPVTSQMLDEVQKVEYSQKYEADRKDDLLYVPKNEEKVEFSKPIKKEEIKNPPKNIVVEEKLKIKDTTVIKKEKEIKPIKEEESPFRRIRNIFIDDDKDRIISSSSRKINAIYPKDIEHATNSYPGYRGPGQLVIYKRGFGRTTQTNEFGKEAVVEDDIVVKLTGANSNIPRNGYVISGHGSAKKWISDNLKIGTKIEITDRTIKAYTTIDSYRYYAKAKIKQVEEILISTKQDYVSRDDKYVYYYLKKAKLQYKKSQKDSSDSSLNCAKESIENASIAYRYTLPYLKDELKGTWIRPTEKSVFEIQRTLDKIKKTGINNVFLETYFHGKTIFPSQVMKEYGFEEQNPIFEGFDPLAVWVKEAHKRGIKVHTWFESFYIGNTSPSLNEKSILSVKPEWMNRTRKKADFEGYVSHPQEHNGYFLDPANPEVVEYLVKLIDEITTRYRVDGVNVDYVRYPNISKENLSNQWGYTKYAREEFQQAYEIDPIDIQANSSMWDDWCEYRKDKITNYVQRVSMLLKYKNVQFSTVIFPDYKVSVMTKFQDWEKWAQKNYINAVTPLILTSDDSLAKNMLEEIEKKVTPNASVYPGLFAGFIESDPEDLLKQIHIVRKLKLNGVILFDWAHLSQNYLNVLKTSVFKQQTY